MSPISSCSRGVAASTGSPTSSRELLREPGSERRATGERDPQQPRRAGLGAVVVERSADLLDEVAERAGHRGAGPVGDLLGHLIGLALQRLGLVEREVQVARDRLGEQPAAEAEHADEARQPGLVGHHHGDARRRC